MISFFHKYRSELLLCALIVEIVVSPLADSHPLIGALLAALILMLLLIGISYIVNNRTIRIAGLLMAGVWLTARVLEALGNSHRIYSHLAPVAGLGLSCMILWAMIDRFHSHSMVTRNLIVEAIINYLVVAIAFSQLYWILNHFVDHPFNQTIARNQTSALLYFSMITLSSVGYGGIVPVNPYVRFIAALESMTGIFYLAVVVARMVSLYRPRHAAS
jgi:hypothetical protein